METIHSRTYTNVALTVLILLLAVLAARPYVAEPQAQAQSISINGRDDDTRTALLKDPYASVARGLTEIAVSNREVAAAIRETAKSQADVARALQSLASPMAK